MSIYLNQVFIERFNFSGGEVHIKIPTELVRERNEVLAFLKSSDDIMSLLMCVDAVRRVNPSARLALTIPYFPYARQDRVCNEGESLSVRVMADLVNSLNCDGGRTFTELAKELKHQGAKDIYLYVTHGIFSQGFDELKKYIKQIYCYYPFSGLGDSRTTTEPFVQFVSSF